LFLEDEGITEIGICGESNAITEKGINILEKGRSCVYSEPKIYAELMNIGVPENLQLDAFLFLIKDASKV